MKRYTTIFLLSLSMVFGSSCKKLLDKEPRNTMTDANFWKDEAEANSAITGAYALLRTAINYPEGVGHYAWGDLPTDQFSATQPLNQQDYANINQMNLQISVSSTAATNDSRMMYRVRRWDNFYRVIDQANRVLKFVPTIPLSAYTSSNPAAAQQRILGEAYFLRAFTYFYILRIWGDVPLVLETVADPVLGQPLPRTPANQVLDQAIKDIETAMPMLTWTSVAAERAVRATRGAAFALLAHIHAWRGAYDKAAPATDSVILKGGYAFVPRSNFTTIFKGQSIEGIFEISQNKTNEGYATGIGTRTSKSPYLLSNTGNTQMPLDPVNLLTRYYTDTTNDLRARRGFALMNTTDPVVLKYLNDNVTYTAVNNTSPVVLHNIVVFRLADIKLLRAEALEALGNPGGARVILDEIRNIAGLGASTATNADLFEAIIDERGRELFLEGHRYYDLVRLAKKKNIFKFGSGSTPRITSSEFAQGKYIWPIDPSLIIQNPLLTQTPYWADKM
ncbi:RagB/SusD family nutrient uptake outer membrane protein [Segetibacter sp. 3557_3]|uniref:RagB/SusD family nutrient uptake outer membrane protein n=1 Tax=Segetibacter sp. 3557_3 TaxID=2547429 RepID=UPI0010586983|nr:RagB/SusD family nutrient uptake outer membrane protein [Segetibacter sp. 3557_3]TDH26609.1 RagB/SusD family nutrient uptake outer membrane protein [Segetibacter sp. 3557_3]